MQTKAWVSIFFLVVGSFWICRYGNKFLSGNFRYYMLPSRFWELGIGTTVAFLLHWLQIKNKSNRICDEIISLAASAWICFAFTQYDVNSSFTEKSLFICIATALFIIFAKKQTLVGKIFTLKPIRFIGKISYSLYLWHWPLIVLGFLMELKYGAINPVIMNVSIIGTAFALSTLSWVYIETPFRKKTTWRECLRPLLSLVMVVALCVVAGDISLARMVSAPDKILLEEPVHKGTSFKDAKRGHYPAFGPNGKLELMVIGDSHSLALYSGLDAMADEFKVAGKIGARSRTFPILSICSVGHCDDPPFVATWLNYIKENNIKHILLVSRWNYIWDKEGLYLKTSKGVSKTNAKTVAGELEKQVRSLLDDGRVVWVLRQVPEFKTHPILAVSLMGADYTEDMTYRNNVDFAEEALQKISSPDLHFIDAAPYLVRDNKLSPVKKNTYLYRDLDHLSPQGAQVIKNAFRPLFETIIRDRQQNQGASTPLF